MISAQALRELMELGLEGERLLAVVTVFERDGARNVTCDAQRHQTVTPALSRAERTARWRAKKLLKQAADGAANKRHIGDVTNVTECHNDLLSSLSTSSYVSENSREIETKKDKRVSDARDGGDVTKRHQTSPKRKLAGPLPDEWSPSASHFEAAQRLNRGRDFVLSKAEDMRLWARSNDARKVDWDATLHGFLRRDAGKGNSNGNRHSVMDAADNLISRIEGFEIEGGDRIIDITPGRL